MSKCELRRYGSKLSSVYLFGTSHYFFYLKIMSLKRNLFCYIRILHGLLNVNPKGLSALMGIIQ